MSDVEVGKEHAGTRVGVHTGDRLVIRVPENATTGYRWQVDSVDGPVQVESDEMVPAADLRPGAGGEHRVVLRVHAQGSGHVAMTLRRPWEAAGAEADRFAIDVDAT